MDNKDTLSKHVSALAQTLQHSKKCSVSDQIEDWIKVGYAFRKTSLFDDVQVDMVVRSIFADERLPEIASKKTLIEFFEDLPKITEEEEKFFESRRKKKQGSS